MNNKRLILALIVLVLLLALVYVMVQSQQSKKSNLTVRTPSKISGFEIIDIGTGRAPRFSPDSKKIVFLSGGMALPCQFRWNRSNSENSID